MTNKVEMLRKITIRNCGFDVKTIKEAVEDLKDGEKIALLRVVGIASSAKAGQTDKGEYLKLMGEYSAINLQTGEQFTAGQCILPNFISDQFAGVLAQHGSAEFALEIGAKADASSVTGYTFTVTPLVESKSSNRMQELIDAAVTNVPMLEAPKPKAPKAAAKKSKK
jgi:hypothetical protein